MRFRACLLSMFAPALSSALFAAPALAQTPPADQMSGLEDDMMFIVSLCQEQVARTDLKSDEKADSCVRAIGEIDRTKNEGDPTPRDLNTWRGGRAFMETHVVRQYLDAGKNVQSERSCKMVEAAWSDLSAIKTGDILPALGKALPDMRKSAAEAAAQCRKEFGTPAGAPPLPN